MQPNIFSNEDFNNECNRRLGIIVGCFTKKEILAIIDFINTASHLTEKEIKEINKIAE